MLIEELFSRGVMAMGPSRTGPERQVGLFRPEVFARLPPVRAAEMEKVRWLAGHWAYENHVPATRLSPSYYDAGKCRFTLAENGAWICSAGPDGREHRHITFDPFSRQWIYVLTQGSYGILRSPEGWVGDRIDFAGKMTMLGIECEWRMRWRKENDDAFGFVNEELAPDGSWQYIDEWHFRRC